MHYIIPHVLTKKKHTYNNSLFCNEQRYGHFDADTCIPGERAQYKDSVIALLNVKTYQRKTIISFYIAT